MFAFLFITFSILLPLSNSQAATCEIGDISRSETTQNPAQPDLSIQNLKEVKTGKLLLTKRIVFEKISSCDPIHYETISPYYYFTVDSKNPVIVEDQASGKLFTSVQDQSLFSQFVLLEKEPEKREALRIKTLAAARKERSNSEKGKYDDPKICTDMTLPAYNPNSPILPIYDQDGLGICTAEATTQAWDNYRFTHGETRTEFLSSPIFAAIGGNSLKTKPRAIQVIDQKIAYPFEGNKVCDIIDFLNMKGSCSLKAIRDRGKKTSIQEVFDLLYRRFTDYQLVKKNTSTAALQICLDLKENGFDMLSSQIDQSMASIEKLLEQDDPMKFLKGVFVDLCPEDQRIKAKNLPACKDDFTDYSTPDAMGDFIQSHLFNPQTHGQPIIASICAALLSEGPGFDPEVEKTPSCGSDGKKAIPHTIQIVGRRFDKVRNRCQILIRNSWGNSPNSSYNSNWENQGGNIWIDQGTLSHNVIGGFSWLE